MSCTASVTCPCERCGRIYRQAYRDGLADAHRVFVGSWVDRPEVMVTPRVLALLLPALFELEWSDKKRLGGETLKIRACPECRAAAASITGHSKGCSMADAVAQARVALVQPDLFGEG